jgi:Protein RETICULATA-related
VVFPRGPTTPVLFPSRSGAKPKPAGLFQRVFAGCPENAFQRSQSGTAPYTLVQRLGAVVRNGTKLSAVGFLASLLGVGVTNGIVTARKALDPSFKPLNAPQDVTVGVWIGEGQGSGCVNGLRWAVCLCLGVCVCAMTCVRSLFGRWSGVWSALSWLPHPATPRPPVQVMAGAYGLYMASSANMRYQVLAGLVEERGIETIFAGKPNVCAFLSFVVRTGNTFLGSILWVDFLRMLNLQPKGGGGGGEPVPAEQ